MFILLVFSWDYTLYRLSMDEDYSLNQRFGFIFEMRSIDFIIGLKDALLPENGIHNGIIYPNCYCWSWGMAYVYIFSNTHTYQQTKLNYPYSQYF